jgi:anti-sigma-K factor RskA
MEGSMRKRKMTKQLRTEVDLAVAVGWQDRVDGVPMRHEYEECEPRVQFAYREAYRLGFRMEARLMSDPDAWPLLNIFTAVWQEDHDEASRQALQASAQYSASPEFMPGTSS